MACLGFACIRLDAEVARRMVRLKVFPAILSVGLAIAVLLVVAVGAQEVVDRIVAVVENDPIFLSEVEEALEEDLYIKSVRGEPLPVDSTELTALQEEVLEGVIERRIVVAKARREGLEVTRTEVEDALDSWLSDLIEAAGSEAAFNAELERQAMTLQDFKAEYRDDVEEQLLVSRFMTQAFRDVSVSDNRIRDFYDNKYDSIPEIPEVVGISHIIIIPRVPPEKEDRAIARVEDIVGELESGEAFADVARNTSDDILTRERGGLIGTVSLDDLQPDLAEIAGRLEVGEVSEPVRTRYGIEIVRLDSRDGDAYTLRHVFVRLHPDRADTIRAARLAQEVRDRIAAGESFESLARDYSDDSETRDNGGYVGEVEVEALDRSYQAALAELDPGEVSDLVRTERGFQILKLVSRTANRKPSFEEARGWIRSLIEARTREALFDEWLEEAREEIYVKRIGL
jgi:peptidyl-prolyl cis-trans isomerase SurA